MNKVQCKHCGQSFDPMDNMGQWQCRMHALPQSYRPSSDNESIYACCGLRSSAAHKASMEFYQTLWQDSIKGCLAVDHQGPEDPPRQASDVALFVTYNQDKIGRNIPPLSLSVNVFTLTLAEAEAHEDIVMNVHVAAPPGSVMEKHIGPVVEDLIREAYKDPSFIGLPEHEWLFSEILGHRDRPSARTIQWPEGKDESYLVDMSKSDFVSFHLIHDTRFKDKLPVPISAVRRAAKQMDLFVLKQVKSFQSNE